MKFNLNPRTSRHRTHSEFVQTILYKLVNEFCVEYDIYDSNKTTENLKDYNGNLPLLIQWANSNGWSITTWELRNPTDNSLYAYGLDFDKECPLFMEARLKYS